jgi:hypothetical protein
MESSRVLFATEGKASDTINLFANEMKNHNSDPTKIIEVTMIICYQDRPSMLL